MLMIWPEWVFRFLILLTKINLKTARFFRLNCMKITVQADFAEIDLFGENITANNGGK